MIGYGTRTLFVKEVRRFMRVPGQTVLSPVVTTVLYLAVFGFALGGRLKDVGGVPYFDFIVPGLVAMGILSNSFLNSASSLMMMKMQGTLVDLLVTPLSHAQVTLAVVAAAASRGLIVGVLTWLAAILLQGTVHVAHPFQAIAVSVLTSIGLGALGLFAGIWAEKFEQINFIPIFVIAPLTFLGGVFYDVRALPGALSLLSHLNPVLYLVEGMRHALNGNSAVHPGLALFFLLMLDVVSVSLCILVLRRGWKLRV
ncbi:MAG: ABC transporter permease [Deltaproteobacteria bacterium]|nr:ABC transporter permease [Deltaproteobacteria bacterium]